MIHGYFRDDAPRATLSILGDKGRTDAGGAGHRTG